MDEVIPDATAAEDEAPTGLVYRAPRTQREVDAIFARLRRWCDAGTSGP